MPEIHYMFGLKYLYTVYYSSITVVLVNVNISCKIHPVCHNIANGIDPGSDSKTTDKHAADCSKAVWWDVT